MEILPNEYIGVKHQRFIIQTKDKQSILILYNISNNISLNIKLGDKVAVDGTYVYNRYGGLIHETHSNINKDQPDGKIELLKSI